VGKGKDWLFVSGGFSLVLSFSEKRKNKKGFGATPHNSAMN
jgi:hypothetical protein